MDKKEIDTPEKLIETEKTVIDSGKNERIIIETTYWKVKDSNGSLKDFKVTQLLRFESPGISFSFDLKGVIDRTDLVEAGEQLAHLRFAATKILFNS